MSTARRAALIAGACATVGGVAALNRALVGVFYDDGLYAGIAVALSHGQGYVHPHLPGSPAVIHYPPLYPLALAPLFGVLSVHAAAIAGKLLNLGLAVLGAALIAWHAVRTNLLGDDASSRWLAPAVVGAAALAIPVLTVQSVLFAEPLFGVLLAAAVILADSPPARIRPGVAAGLAGLAAALVLLTRTIGLAAGGGIALFLLVVRRAPRRHVVVALVPSVLAAVGWGIWTVAHRSGIDPALAINYGSYAEVVSQSGLGAFGRMAPDLVRPLGGLTLGWLPVRWLYFLFGLPALAVGLYGFALVVRRSSIGLTLAGYFLILALWPFLVDRFLWAVLPWLALIWGAGAIGLARAIPRFRLVVLVVAAVLGVGYVQYEVRGALGRWWASQQMRISDNFAELLPGLTDLGSDAVLATDDEPLVWLYTRRTTVPFYVYGFQHGEEVHLTPAVHRAYLVRQGVTHVLFSGFGSGSDQELDALLGAYPGWLTVMRRWPGGRALFRVHDER